MSEVIKREVWEIKVCHLEDGTAWVDVFATEGEFKGFCVSSAEGDTPYLAMLDCADRLYGERSK